MEVRKLLSLKSMDEWNRELEKRGSNHDYYYHYTTLGTLKAIILSKHWKLHRFDEGNDPCESKVLGSSFTISSLSSMGMWYWYSHMREKNDIGVRIKIPANVFKEIFSESSCIYKLTEGSYEPLFSSPVEDCKIKITDVAYWHFGKAKENANDMLFYKSYAFPEKALGSYDKNLMKKSSKNSFQCPKNLPPSFKKAIWRTESETRVYVDLRKHLDSVPSDIYVKIPDDAFEKMEYRLDPSFSYDNLLSRFDDPSKAIELLDFS